VDFGRVVEKFHQRIRNIVKKSSHKKGNQDCIHNANNRGYHITHLAPDKEDNR